MSQHHKLIYGSLFALFAATHAGCAGSGLKNVFTRNETDGYHSLGELETEEQAVADTEASDDEVQKPSMANRLASWRPFSKTEPTAEGSSAATETDASAADSEEGGPSRGIVGRAFTKRESVEPDPFLSAEPGPVSGPKSPGTVRQKKIAASDDESNYAETEFAFEGDPKPKSAKGTIADSRKRQHESGSTDAETNAVALGASRKADSTARSSDNEDEALTKRFEQHFLLNSIGTVAKTETEAAAVGDDLRRKVSTSAESKKREFSSIADREANPFDFQLAADPDSDETTSDFGSNSDAAPLRRANRNVSTSEKSGNSLAAFDQLMGTDQTVTSHDETDVTNAAGQRQKKKAGALDINVADTEALFGAAAARQNARLPQSGTSNRQASADRYADRNSALWQESEYPKQSDGNHGDVASAFASHLSGISGNRRVRSHNAEFGASPTSAGDVDGEDNPVEETPNVRLSNTSALSNEHGIVTANYGTVRPNVVHHSAATEASTSGDGQFTEAPAAPVSQQGSVSGPDSAAARPGFVQSFSTRNWLLLIGGVIVIALLFAPGRTKPLTMNGRPANG